MPTPARYDDIADFYDDFYGDQVQDPATDALLELTGELAGRRVLDLACGQGRLAREVARRGAAVAGLDLSSALIGKASAPEQEHPLGITYLVGDAADASFLPEASFDIILCGLSFTDFDDLDGVLANVARWLAGQGRFVFSMPHPCFPGSGPVPSSWQPIGSYFDEGYWQTNGTGIRSKVGAHHRTLATYINALSQQGLTIEAALERAWSRPELPDLGRLPGFLIARARKAS